MSEAEPSYEELRELEPRLAELERRVDAIRDDGKGSFFCSNFAWLPISVDLRVVVGAYSRRPAGEGADDARGRSEAYRTAYLELSRRLPPCRDCGCRVFVPFREEQLDRDPEGPGGPEGPE